MSYCDDGKIRCNWATGSELMAQYHDEEWGVPLHDDARLFEYLTLETMQAGLSWSTILNRREAFRRAFFDFDLDLLASKGQDQVELWMEDTGIIRNQAKLKAIITNAAAFQKIQSEFGSFAGYQWRFVDGVPLVGGWAKDSELPAVTELSHNFAKDLKRRGFAFIGPTTCYAHMQATGMVDDHLATCWRRT
jgi:DNA-3-methyladenine glycosylase I